MKIANINNSELTSGKLSIYRQPADIPAHQAGNCVGLVVRQ